MLIVLFLALSLDSSNIQRSSHVQFVSKMITLMYDVIHAITNLDSLHEYPCSKSQSDYLTCWTCSLYKPKNKSHDETQMLQ